jgi:hypothetical protein
MSHPIDPRIIPTAYGKYLAVSRSGDDPAIGVIGDTEDEARQLFSKAVERILELRELAIQENAEAERGKDE